MTTQGRADINTYLPVELLSEIFLYSIEANQMKSGQLASVCHHWRSVITGDFPVSTYFPTELFREIFLYCIEANQMKSGQLASVCRYWRSVITSIASIWSTLRVGTWTETERVALWLQRAYPKRIIIDPQRDSQGPSKAPMFAALQNALAHTGQWHELTIASFPPENLASQLDVQVASPMNVLKVLHVAAGCVDSPSFSHLLNLVPTEAPITELILHPSFASAHFLRPHWFSVLQNLTVLTVNGRDIHEPFELLPTFTQIQIFEADHLCLPIYEPNTTLPLLSTLRKLRLRACSIQWMVGRQFSCLEECTILLPRHWETIHQCEVQLPSCKKLTYHGHPITTAQNFRVPEMREVELRSHDCKDKRVYQQLHHLFTLDGWVSKLTTLHLALQCSELAFINVLRYLSFLQELNLSIVYPSPSWQSFLESLAAVPYGNDWLDEGVQVRQQGCAIWCSSRTWYVNILPYLKSLGIQCPKGFSQSECLDNCPLLRHVGWTRAQLTPPLEHLKVWEGRGTADDIVVDYVSTRYLEKYLGILGEKYDPIIVGGMITKYLLIDGAAIRVFQLRSTILFRQLQELVVSLSYYSKDIIPIFPYLEQIKRLAIWDGIIPVYPLRIDLPLTRTLQWLKLDHSTSSWMIGRSFKALREFEFNERLDDPQIQYRNEGLHVDLPACTTLIWRRSKDFLRFLSCPNVQSFHFQRQLVWDEAPRKSLTNFLCNCSCLQQLDIHIPMEPWWAGSMTQFVLCEAREQGAWRDIKSVKVSVDFYGFSWGVVHHFYAETVGRQQHYEKWWKQVAVTKEHTDSVIITAST